MSELEDAFVGALRSFLKALFKPTEEFIEEVAPRLLDLIVGTPAPERVFGRPTNGPWPQLYEYYWEAVVPVSLALFGLMVGIVIFLEGVGGLFSGHQRVQLKRRAFVGLLGVLSWWWLAAIALRLVAAFTAVILPDLSGVSLFQTVSFSALGLLGFVLSLAIDLGLVLVLAMIYLIRKVVLYFFVLLMPILIVCWIPNLGPMAFLSRFTKRMAGMFVPFLFMTVPVAMLLRLGGLLGESLSLSLGGVGAWLLALVIPVIAVISPLVMVWQAGALFVMLDRVGRQVSGRKVTRRVRAEPADDRGGRSGGRGAGTSQAAATQGGAATPATATRSNGGDGSRRRTPSANLAGESRSPEAVTSESTQVTTRQAGPLLSADRERPDEFDWPSPADRKPGTASDDGTRDDHSRT